MSTRGEDIVHAETFETNMKFGGMGRSALWTRSLVRSQRHERLQKGWVVTKGEE